MMAPRKHPPLKPAYKEPWFWMVTGPLIFVIVWGIAVVIFAYQVADDRVMDDYYKEGRMINNAFAGQKYAVDMGIEGVIEIDEDTSTLVVDLKAQVYPNELTIKFSHPAQAKKDFSLALTPITQNRYAAPLPKDFLGNWYIELEGVTTTQELKWKITLSIDTQTSRRFEFKAHY